MRAWPPYQTVRPLVHRHLGRAAVVVGGGPTMPGAIPRCPTDAIYLSVNDHGTRFFKDNLALARPIDYMVACDKIERRARADVGRDEQDVVERRDGLPWNVPVVSRHMWADFRMLAMIAPSSGMAAAWLARFMGCGPIVLVGMDLYCGPTYFDAPAAKSSGRTVGDVHHLERWATLLKTYPAQYRCIDCSVLLRKLTGTYDAEEPAEPAVPIDRLLGEVRGSWVKLTRDVTISMREFRAGSVLELAEGEAAKMVREKHALKLKNGEAT